MVSNQAVLGDIISVYLNRKEVERGESVFEIEFSTDDFSGEYDIKNDADKFQRYLDAEEYYKYSFNPLNAETATLNGGRADFIRGNTGRASAPGRLRIP